MHEHQQVNRANWDDRAPAHAASPDYRVERFVADPGYLSDVVRFDLPRLGEVAGLTGVHLQCHIGTDTISLARLGARMTGLDFSGVSLEHARRIAARARAEVDFVEADVYDALTVLAPGTFDLVFTGIGSLGWLPDIDRWAQVVAALLKPGGRLFLRECHPVVGALGRARPDHLLVLEHPYFELQEPRIGESVGTYVQTDASFTHTQTRVWNHGLGEIITALLAGGLQLTELTEHDSLPWEQLPGQMEQLGGGEWRVSDRPWRLPHSYTLQAVKAADQPMNPVSVYN
jgi:SAM-dependent methyltransferase